MKLYLYVILAISCAILTTYTNAHPGDLVEPIDTPFVEKYKSKELDFITIGDWGFEENQQIVAKEMRKWAESNHSDFIINVGDNFYVSFKGDHDGVTSVNDPKWDRDWKKPYGGRLGVIPWYTVGGNHDWYGNITAQVDYSLNYDRRFYLPSTFYVRETYFGPHKTKVAWIHIDTNIFFYDQALLAQGKKGKKGKKDKKKKMSKEIAELAMEQQFEQFGWNNEQEIQNKIKWIEDRLIEQQNSKWIFVVGHHPLIGDCKGNYYMKSLRPLFEKYRVAAYFMGHKHNLELETAKPGQPITYFLSGAGSRSASSMCEGNDWSAPVGVLGFLHSTLKDDEMVYQFVDSTNAKVIYQGKISPRPM